jgi:predicted small lipoprotein YifL
MKYSYRLPAALLLSMFLFGCGQSGPLYVSGNPSSVEVPASQADSEEEDEQDGESSAAE